MSNLCGAVTNIESLCDTVRRQFDRIEAAIAEAQDEV